MAIKHMSEQINLPRVGKIHLGIKDKDKGFPKLTEYFVVKEDGSTPKEAADAFKAVYGDKPNKLDVIISCENDDIFFPQYLKSYNGKKQLICKGDGEKAQRMQDDGTYSSVQCKGKECDAYKGKKCREVANFKIMLPKVKGIGVWQIDTSSVHSIISLNSAINFIKLQTNGRISGIPLILSLQPKEIVWQGMKKTIYILTLSSEASLNDISIKASADEGEYPYDLQAADDERAGIEPEDADEVDDYPIDPDNADNKAAEPVYEIVEIGDLKGRTALRIKKGNEEPIMVLSKEKINEKKGTKINATIEQQGNYHVLLNYKKIA